MEDRCIKMGGYGFTCYTDEEWPYNKPEETPKLNLTPEQKQERWEAHRDRILEQIINNVNKKAPTKGLVVLHV